MYCSHHTGVEFFHGSCGELGSSYCYKNNLLSLHAPLKQKKHNHLLYSYIIIVSLIGWTFANLYGPFPVDTAPYSTVAVGCTVFNRLTSPGREKPMYHSIFRADEGSPYAGVHTLTKTRGVQRLSLRVVMMLLSLFDLQKRSLCSVRR